MNVNELNDLLTNNIVWLSFIEKGDGTTRKMICTKNWKFLNSVEGKLRYKYRTPTQPPSYDPLSRNNVIVWDMVVKDFRTVWSEHATILNFMSVDDFVNRYGANLNLQARGRRRR